MYYTLGVHVVECAQELLHVMCGHIFREHLILHLRNLIEQFASTNVLHDQIDVLLVDVGLVITDDVGVVELGKDVYLLADCLYVVSQLGLVHDLDGDNVLLVVLVERAEYLTEGARAENVGVRIDLVVLLQFFGTLFLGRAQGHLLFLTEDHVLGLSFL